MLRTGFVLALSITLFAATAPAQVTLGIKDADIGGDITFEFASAPNKPYINIISLNEGPTCFSAPHTVGCIPVGLDLFKFSFSIPGFFGKMPGSGSKSLTYPVPNVPAMDGLQLNDVLVSIDNGRLVEASDLYRITFAYAGDFNLSLYGMVQNHAGTQAVSLDDGRVLLAGGAGPQLKGSEVYIPNLEEFSSVKKMKKGSTTHATVKLLDGRVLVMGGVDVYGAVRSRSEIYDPATDTWTTSGALKTGRALHTATLLPNGGVLVAGGSDDLTDGITALTSALSSTEIWNPTNGRWSYGPDLNTPHTAHNANALANGDVLISGGGTYYVFIFRVPDLSEAVQRYNYSSGSFDSEIYMKEERVGHSSVTLSSGHVLLAGGLSGDATSQYHLSNAEVYNPSSNSTSYTANNLSQARSLAVSVLMPDGRVVLAGGDVGSLTSFSPVDTTDTYDPNSNRFSSATPLTVTRSAATGVLLPDNSVGIFLGNGGQLKVDLYHN